MVSYNKLLSQVLFKDFVEIFCNVLNFQIFETKVLQNVSVWLLLKFILILVIYFKPFLQVIMIVRNLIV